MTEELFHFVDGERRKGISGRFSNVFNPATGDVTKQTPLANAD